MKTKLYNWSVIANATPYTAPEAITYHLYGTREGELIPVTTSHIVAANGRDITTRTGSVYTLETIDPTYLKYIHDNGIKYDYAEPIKLLKV